MSAKGRMLGTAAATVASLALFAAVTSPALAVPTRESLGAFCEPSGIATPPCTPAFSHPEGLAVDPVTGDVLVIDSAAGTVSRYKPDGEPAPFAALGSNVIDGKGTEAEDKTPQNGLSFGAANEVQVAVAPAGSAAGTAGDIYVTQAASGLVDIFAPSGHYLGQLTKFGASAFGEPCGVAVDGSGHVFVSDYYFGVFEFVPSANPPVNSDYTEPPISSGIHRCTLAAGAGPTAGSLFSASWESKPVFKIDVASRTAVYQFGPTAQNIVSVAPSDGHVFVAESSGAHRVAEFDATGTEGARELSAVHPASAPTGVASPASDEKLLVAEQGAANIEVFGPTLPLPVPVTLHPSPVGETSATLRGTVNPKSLEVTSCSFEYLTEAAYEANEAAEVDPFEGASSVPCAESSGEIGMGSEPVDVHADVSGLGAGVPYRVRLVVENASGREDGAGVKFVTTVPPEIEAWVSGVTGSEATLTLRVVPRYYATAVHVDYGAGASYGQSSPQYAAGSDNTAHDVTISLGGLTPGVTYHWRAVAASANGKQSETADSTFTTYLPLPARGDCANQSFRSGAAAPLPDCRAYEMVSPVDKGGADIAVNNSGALGLPARLDQSAASGDSLTYTSNHAFAGSVSGVYAPQYLASRVAGSGWSSRGISPPLEGPFGAAAVDTEFKAFSADLSYGWVYHGDHPRLDSSAPAGYEELYRRENAADSYLALNRAVPAIAESSIRPELQGISADGSRSVFRATAKLTADASAAIVGGQPVWQLYESQLGTLHLLSVLPDGEACGSGFATAGTARFADETGRFNQVAGSVSDDASRVYFGCGADGSHAKLYLRENPEAPQSASGECDEAGRACTVAVSAGDAEFMAASSDGATAIYREGGALYEFDLASRESHLISEGVAEPLGGLVGVSANASRVYFATSHVLSAGNVDTENSEGDEAIPGRSNLYLYEAGEGGGEASFAFVGTLGIVGGYTPISLAPVDHMSAVSSDGLVAVFMSTGDLTGYDATDSESGEEDAEVYRYDAGSDSLSCVSCNPAGSRPRGRRLADQPGFVVAAGELWAASWVPAWENQLYQPRYLAGDDRVFFNSFDSLVPRDTNEAQDVYEWEAAGDSAACEAAGAELYVPASEGCISLISTGESKLRSEFVDANPGGRDAFFTTDSSLVPQDPGLVDIYDAREGGGFPAPPTPNAPCQGEACQGPAAVPQAQTPASSEFSQEGNVPHGKSKRCPKGRRRVRRHGKAHCLKKRRHRRHHKHHRRGRRHHGRAHR